MADYAGQIVDVIFASLRDQPHAQTISVGSAVTYYYRTSGGTRGSTTSLSSIPAGAVIERIA